MPGGENVIPRPPDDNEEILMVEKYIHDWVDGHVPNTSDPDYQTDVEDCAAEIITSINDSRHQAELDESSGADVPPFVARHIQRVDQDQHGGSDQ